MAGISVEIICAACGADTLVKKEPKYEGFKKVGEQFVCVSCRHVYASEAEVPFKQKRASTVFSEDDKPRQVRVFREDEKGRCCRYCTRYVVNPFIQRCSLHHKEVQATDLCDDFERKKDEPDPGTTGS